ncbi:uncharacterized protein LOC126654142 isoform X1 [Mercurialis annua]|uniref:uncharacterized protein LOC126654142 isoform X1 n=1 Tax=Mercurialis annua TaxID=3986 RepID=UPI00215E0643|nr:uncharacterized protein LOC126654142 isoform X1 [Mercurialis annua]
MEFSNKQSIELSQPLAIESFSLSWLTNMNSPLDVLEDPLRASIDRSLKEVHNFNFDVPDSKYLEPFVHADQLFSDGYINTVFIDHTKIEATEPLGLIPTACSSFSSRTVVSSVHIERHILKRWINSSDRILQKCFGYIRPLCRKITGTRKSTNAEDRRPRRVKIWRKLPCTGARRSTRVDDIDRRARKSWSNLPQASPYIAYSTNNWCDIESPIDEAVLHCKRSTDK